MKKRRWMLIPLALCLLSGCSGSSSTDTNRISVDKDGTIDTAIVESFDQDYYDKDELKQNIEDEIDTYNKQAGTEQIEMKSFKIRKEIARVRIVYDNYQAYADFNHVSFFNGTVEDAIATGLGTDENLAKVDDNLVTTLQELANAEDTYYVAIVKEPLQVETSGKIIYVSSNVTVDDEKLATVTASSSVIAPVTDTADEEETDTAGVTESTNDATPTVLGEAAYIVYE